MIKKWDIILIVTLLLLSFLPEGIFLATGSGEKNTTYAVVQVDGKEYNHS